MNVVQFPGRNPDNEARKCLSHMLGKTTAGNYDIREVIEEALDEVEEARLVLWDLGVHVLTEGAMGAGICVSNAAEDVRELFAGTQWDNGAHAAALSGLPGALRHRPIRFHRSHSTPSVFIPAHLVSV